MPTPSDRTAVLSAQRAWAKTHRLTVDDKGYLPDVRANLFQPMSTGAEEAFSLGSGAEMNDWPASDDRPGQAAKMRALHSSSALAVNVFDFWTERDLSRVLTALGVTPERGTLEFEKKLPTGARGIPPNVDVVIRLSDGGYVGIESKFTEWMMAKTDMASSLDPMLTGTPRTGLVPSCPLPMPSCR